MYEITLFRHVTPCSLVDRNNSCNTLKCNKKTRVTSTDISGAIWHISNATQQVPAAASTASTAPPSVTVHAMWHTGSCCCVQPQHRHKLMTITTLRL